ncbi:MAG TPA: phosphate/phosphite/phosphonate ABC transporter substrate-binding protein [Nitrospirota bacterium]
MKRRTAELYTLMSLFVFLALSWCRPAPSSAEIKLGILPRLNAVEMSQMFSPLAAYLTKEVGEKVTLVIPKDFISFKDLVKSGQVDIAFSNPLVYVQLRQAVHLEPLALSSEPKSGTRFRGIVIARKDSGIEKLQDLKGKKLIFVDKDSAAGYIFQMLLLSKAGLDVKTDFTQLPFAKKHDNVTMAVFNKTADAGGIREDDLAKMKDKVDLSQLRIVGYTDYFPNWPLFALPKLQKETATKIRAALLKLKPNAPLSGTIVKAAQLTGFVPVADKDYDNLRKAASIAGAL